MSIKRRVVSRAGTLAAAIAVALGALVPVLSPIVSAAQVQTRSIEMSDSTPSQTGVSYTVTFDTATSGANSLVIDFCENSSIIGGTCDTTTTTPVNVSTATLAAGTGFAGWTIGAQTATTIRLTNSSGTPLNGTGLTFTLNGVTNPAATGTFWARIYTYTSTSYGNYSNAATPGSYLDYGGFAMSTAQLINITATVMETLTFCTSGYSAGTPPGPSCGLTGQATTTPNLTLGHGTPAVLDSTSVDTDRAYFQISTNALTGAIVRMKTHNTCSGLSRDGGTDLCPIAGNGVLAGITAGAARFGMHLTSVGDGTGTVVPDSDYDGTTSTNYGMGGSAQGGTNDVTSTYGADIATTNGTATASVNALMTFGAQAAVVTPAGVYTANESLIATGTF